MSEKGLFITFEGGEGCGKTTQLNLLKEKLQTLKIPSVFTREPGGTPEAEQIRNLLFSCDLDPMTEVLLFAAARREHLINKIIPELENGKVVVSDRFIDSTRVYQSCGMGIDINIVDDLYKKVAGDFDPDLTFIFDIDPKLGLERSLKHNLDINSDEDRYEKMGLEFHNKVRAGFLNIAKKYPQRCVVIDASADIETIHSKILDIVDNNFDLDSKCHDHSAA